MRNLGSESRKREGERKYREIPGASQLGSHQPERHKIRHTNERKVKRDPR